MFFSKKPHHTAIFDAFCACLGLGRDSREAAALIHEAYAEPENAPRLPRNRNVIYWTLLQDPASDPVSTAYNPEPAGTGRNSVTVYTTLKYQLIIPQPAILYEEEGSLWRKRADLTISLRVQYAIQAPERNSIMFPPAVLVHR